MSGLPELDVASVRRWCDARVPARARDQVRVAAGVTDRHVTIVECRPQWQADPNAEWRFAIARLRYTKSTGLWTLYWRDSNEKFHEYDRAPATRHVEQLLAELKRDPTALFWG